MPVADELSSLRTGAGEPQAIDDVVQALLELTQEFLAGRLRPAAAGIEIACQLPSRDAIEPLDLLLLSQLEQVVGITLASPALLSGAALLPGRIGAANTAALARDLAGSLQTEFDPGATGEFLNGTTRRHGLRIPLYAGPLNVCSRAEVRPPGGRPSGRWRRRAPSDPRGSSAVSGGSSSTGSDPA